MAGDWIKMRTDLHDDPTVVQMAERLKVDEVTIVGMLHKLWAWADRQLVDGVALGIGAAFVNRLVGHPEFADNLASLGWLEVTENGIEFPNFDKHMSQSAKRRAQNMKTARQRRSVPKLNDASRQQSTLTNVGEESQGNSHVPQTLRDQVYTRDQLTCQYCGRVDGQLYPDETEFDGELTIDHVVPSSRGGGSSLDNLVTCCRKCNTQKGNKTPEEMGWPSPFCQQRVLTKPPPDAHQRREEKRRVLDETQNESTREVVFPEEGDERKLLWDEAERTAAKIVRHRVMLKQYRDRKQGMEDRQVVLKIAALFELGCISGDDLWSVCEAVNRRRSAKGREPLKKPTAYFQKLLTEKLGGDGVLNTLLAQVDVPDDVLRPNRDAEGGES